MSEVWLAEDERLGRWVAVKVLRQALAGEQEGELISGIQREARVVARLQHPGIAGIYDAGTHNGTHYLVMEYVHGLSVRELLASRHRLSEAEAIRYGSQVASALHHAHEQGVIHCDVKPENILVTEQGVAKIADFGIAEAVTQTLSPAEAREILGTIAYLAPEVIQGAAPDARSDVYSLGLVVYEMVAGRLPFTGTTPAAIASQRLAAAPTPLRTFAMDASPELEAVLARAIAPSGADRFASAAEFAAALRRAQPRAGAPVTAPATVPVERPPRAIGAAPPPRRHATTLVRRGAVPPPPRRSGANGAMLAAFAAVLLALGAGLVAALVVSRDGDSGGASATATATLPPAITPSPTRSATATPTTPPEPTATSTPTRTPTPRPSPSPTATPTRTPTRPGPTATPTPAPRSSPSASPSPPGGSPQPRRR